VAGAASDSLSGDRTLSDFAVARYQLNGELDSAFGVNGKLIIDLNNSYDVAYSVDIQVDQKILVAGGSDYNFAMVRYLPSGMIDRSFGVNGKVLTDYKTNGGRSAVLQPDGKIVFEIDVDRTGDLEYDCALVRYNSNGKLDSSFGVNGFGDSTNFHLFGFGKQDITLQTDGKIVLAGSRPISWEDFTGALVRFNQDGRIDSSFGVNGLTIISADQATSVAIQADGKIIAGGFIDLRPSYADFALARYTTNGKPDSTFGLNGRVITNFDKYSLDYARSIAIQADGKIIAAGYTDYTWGLVSDFALARYTETGQLVSSFGINGKVVTDFANGASDEGYSVCLQADGKLIVAGVSNHDFAVARYNNDEVLPVTIINLKAYSVGSNVKIEWTALNELNIVQYNIERSVDGKNFITISNAKALDNGQQKMDYSYMDQMPAGGDNFYRIKSVSKDGAPHYTGIVKVNFVSAPSSIILSPNPAKDLLYIQGLSSSAKTISVIDVKGKLLQQVTTANSNYVFNVKQLAAGIYFIRIDEAGNVITLKFVKER
jgi:uncharacterized delta-60 repeat protein